MPLSKERTKEIVAEFGTNEKDSGRTETQIALLTERITQLTEHFQMRVLPSTTALEGSQFTSWTSETGGPPPPPVEVPCKKRSRCISGTDQAPRNSQVATTADFETTSCIALLHPFFALKQ